MAVSISYCQHSFQPPLPPCAAWRLRRTLLLVKCGDCPCWKRHCTIKINCQMSHLAKPITRVVLARVARCNGAHVVRRHGTCVRGFPEAFTFQHLFSSMYSLSAFIAVFVEVSDRESPLSHPCWESVGDIVCSKRHFWRFPHCTMSPL